MNEKDLNRIIVKSFKKIGFAHKISDDAQNFTATGKKPFDYFAINPYGVIYGESKFIKGIYSFNFKRLESHQIESLKTISALDKIHNNIYTLISLGLWESRKYFYVLFFEFSSIMNLINKGIKSVNKKILEEIISDGKYMDVKKDEILGIENYYGKIIRNLETYYEE